MSTVIDGLKYAVSRETSVTMTVFERQEAQRGAVLLRGIGELTSLFLLDLVAVRATDNIAARWIVAMPHESDDDPQTDDEIAASDAAYIERARAAADLADQADD